MRTSYLCLVISLATIGACAPQSEDGSEELAASRADAALLRAIEQMKYYPKGVALPGERSGSSLVGEQPTEAVAFGILPAVAVAAVPVAFWTAEMTVLAVATVAGAAAAWYIQNANGDRAGPIPASHARDRASAQAFAKNAAAAAKRQSSKKGSWTEKDYRAAGIGASVTGALAKASNCSPQEFLKRAKAVHGDGGKGGSCDDENLRACSEALSCNENVKRHESLKACQTNRTKRDYCFGGSDAHHDGTINQQLTNGFRLCIIAVSASCDGKKPNVKK